VPVAPEVVRPLRKEVLRPGTPLAELVFERDLAPSAMHAAVLDGNRIAIAVGSAMPDPHPREPAAGDWRVRGMATREDMRRQGLGAAVLGFCERHARAQGSKSKGMCSRSSRSALTT